MSTLSLSALKNPSSGSDNVTLNADGTTTIAAPSNLIKSGTAVASTSGTAIDFTGIPSWAKRVTVMFNGVSTNGTSRWQIQFGTGTTPTYTTSGYNGYAFNTSTNAAAGGSITSGVPISNSPVAAGLYSGLVTVVTLGGNVWAVTSYLGGNNDQGTGGGGSIALGSSLTAVRITTVNGTDTFDAGSINITWEG